jgi:glycerol-3-phosphate dehydrogenase subunit C
MLARAKQYKNKRRSLLDWMMSHSDIMSKLASPMAALSNFGMANPLTKLILKQVGITDTMSLPKYASKTFLSQFRAFKQQSFPDKVVFFSGCFINYYAPEVGMDLVAVMQKNNMEVIVPEGLDCCGSPLVGKGYLDEAMEKGRKNIAALKSLIDQGIPVLTCCTSCGLMLKMEYQELMDLDYMDKLAANTYDASEFLLERHEQGKLNLDLAPLAGRYIYHTPCHLRAQGIGRPSFDLLSMIPGFQIEAADAGCCGQSGTYGFEVAKHDIAMAIAEPVFQRIKEYQPDYIVSDCSGCRMQLSQGTGFPALHPLTILRQSYEAKQS